MQFLDSIVPAKVREQTKQFILSIPEDQLDWPENRWSPSILCLLSYIPAQEGFLCDPQIVRQPKGDEPLFLTFHLDEVPKYAGKKKYSAIVGVAITHQDYENGGVTFVEDSGYYTPYVPSGGIFSFDDYEYHSPGVNQKDDPRIAVYFRFLGTNYDQSI